MSDENTDTDEAGEPEPLPVGLREIAIQAGVPADTVKKWRARHADFPRPRWTVGGDAAWDWRDIHGWLIRTGRRPAHEHFRYRDLGDTVLLETLNADGQWVPWVKFVGSWLDGWQIFPCPELVETSKNPDVVAWRLLRSWEAARVEWANAHPGEPLPRHLVPQEYPGHP